jgi:3-hydroxyisobutyrate dehydrogenase
VDSSTIDPGTANTVAKAAAAGGNIFADAPVSGGVLGAENATLTFMVGCDASMLERVKAPLDLMGKNVVHCGEVGSGQAAKLCNNLVLAVSMAGVAEGMLLGERLGVDKNILAGIFNTSTARCWSSDTYNPCPGVMEGVPASRDFEGGFATALMLKDLGLALQAAGDASAPTPTLKHVTELFEASAEAGFRNKDFGAIYAHLKAL